MVKRPSPRVNVAISFALAIGLGVSITLIVLGGRDQTTGDTTPTTSPPEKSIPPTATLPPSDGGAVAIAALAGLTFPADMVDYRSAANPNGQQLDVMFAAPASSVTQFVTGSNLPTPTEERLILHGSPLWDLNPPGESTITSTQDTHRKVTRTVEIVTNNADPAANVVVRMSLAPAT